MDQNQLQHEIVGRTSQTLLVDDSAWVNNSFSCVIVATNTDNLSSVSLPSSWVNYNASANWTISATNCSDQFETDYTLTFSYAISSSEDPSGDQLLKKATLSCSGIICQNDIANRTLSFNLNGNQDFVKHFSENLDTNLGGYRLIVTSTLSATIGDVTKSAICQKLVKDVNRAPIVTLTSNPDSNESSPYGLIYYSAVDPDGDSITMETEGVFSENNLSGKYLKNTTLNLFNYDTVSHHTDPFNAAAGKWSKNFPFSIRATDTFGAASDKIEGVKILWDTDRKPIVSITNYNDEGSEDQPHPQIQFIVSDPDGDIPYVESLVGPFTVAGEGYMTTSEGAPIGYDTIRHNSAYFDSASGRYFGYVAYTLRFSSSSSASVSLSGSKKIWDVNRSPVLTILGPAFDEESAGYPRLRFSYSDPDGDAMTIKANQENRFNLIGSDSQGTVLSVSTPFNFDDVGRSAPSYLDYKNGLPNWVRDYPYQITLKDYAIENSYSGTIRVWDTPRYPVVSTVSSDAGGSACAYNAPAGTSAYSPDGDPLDITWGNSYQCGSMSYDLNGISFDNIRPSDGGTVDTLKCPYGSPDSTHDWNSYRSPYTYYTYGTMNIQLSYQNIYTACLRGRPDRCNSAYARINNCSVPLKSRVYISTQCYGPLVLNESVEAGEGTPDTSWYGAANLMSTNVGSPTFIRQDISGYDFTFGLGDLQSYYDPNSYSRHYGVHKTMMSYAVAGFQCNK
jgi:hypothetical protein